MPLTPGTQRRVTERLDPAYRTAIARVKETYPSIDTYVDFSLSGPACFNALASFCYDLASAEFEDLLLYFTHGPADRGGFYLPSGQLVFPDAGDREAMKFEIERGTGELLAGLDPVLLPDDDASDEYEAAVLAYVDKSIAFVNANMDLIVDALNTPYRG